MQSSGRLVQPSTSTQITLRSGLSASLTWAMVPRPTGPATGMMMSAPSSISDLVVDLPLSWSWKSPVKRPSVPFQPRTSTFLALSLLYCWTPARKPSMKMVTVGIWMPP